jgi:signal transduction histidine kinase
MAESLLGVHDLPSLWPLMKTAVTNTLQPDRLAIYLYNAEADTLSCPYAFGLSNNHLKWINESFHDVPGSALLYKLAPVVVKNVQTEPSLSHRHDALVKEGLRTMAVFPLTTDRGAPAGAMTLYWNEIRPLSQSDISTGHTLAHMVALAMNSIMLFNQTSQSLQREKHLGEISHAINVATNLPSLLNNIIKMVADVVQANSGLLGLVINRDIMTFYPHNIPHQMNLRPAPRPRGLAWKIVTSCEPIIITDYPNHPDAMQKWVDAGVTRFIGVPLQAGENCLGMLALFNLNYSAHYFDQRDLDLVESVGRQVGTAIQNLRMLAETQQRAEAMAAALKRQAELDRMKSNFTQNLSHELRSPLGIIYGHAELLASEDYGSLNKTQRQSSEIIMRRALMLTNLVDDLTTLLTAETQELRREEIDTMLLVYSLLADYRMRAESLGISLESKIEEPMPWMRGDSTHLRRVFDNLFSNAFKFTPAGGSITLRLNAVEETICIEVADSGEGIAKDQLGRIFERFYQTDGSKRRHQGTGLGLSLVKEIVEAHRGTIKVKSEVGVGTTFTIMIPGYIPE